MIELKLRTLKPVASTSCYFHLGMESNVADKNHTVLRWRLPGILGRTFCFASCTPLFPKRGVGI